MAHIERYVVNYMYMKVPDKNGWIHGIRFDHPACRYFPDYSININGDVYSHRTHQMLKKLPCTGSNYLEYQLYNNDRVYHCKIHRLVALNFIPRSEEDIKTGRNYVNHIDMDVTNNHASNLEWCTVAENNIHAIVNGSRDYKKYSWFKTAAQYLLKNGKSINEIYEQFKETGINKTTILYWARELGIRYNNTYTNDTRSKIIEMLKTGITCAEIVRYFKEKENMDIPYTTVNNISQQLGIRRKNDYRRYMNDIVNDLKSGMTRREVFNKWNPICGISDSGVGKIIQRYGLSKIDRSYKEHEEEILADFKNGMTPIQVRRKWNLTESVSKLLAKKAGYSSGIKRGPILEYTDEIKNEIYDLYFNYGYTYYKIQKYLREKYGAGSIETVRRLIETKRSF